MTTSSRPSSTNRWPGTSVETATFAERDGRTLLTVRSVFPSVEDRDGMIRSRMEKGLVETHDRFAELLVELRSAARS